MKTVIAMSRNKILLGFGLFIVSLMLFIIPVLAQDDDTGGENPGLEQFRMCQQARQELREAGTPINPDDLPEACRLNGAAHPFAACRAAIRELRRTSDEPVTREDIQELEACAKLPRFNGEEDAPAALSDDDESPARGWRYGLRDSHHDGERGQRSTPCLDALQELREAGEFITQETMPEVCQTFLSPEEEAEASD